MFKKALVVLMAASALSFALTGCDKTETKTENAGTEAKSEEAKSGEAKSTEAKEEKKAEAKSDSSKDPLAGASFDGDYKIDVILKTTSSEYWSYVVAGAKAFEKDHPNVKVEVKGASSETAYDEQQNMIETDLNSGSYDGYVIAPLQADL